MMNVKRILAFVLSLCMVLTLAPLSALATEIEIEQGAVTSESQNLAFEKLENVDVTLDKNGMKDGLEAIEQIIADDEVVKVLIIMEGLSVIECEPTATVNSNSNAIVDELEEEQAEVVEQIEESVLEGEKLDITYNYTWLLNGVAAEVPYGSIQEILAVDGVKQVLIQPVYEVCATEVADPQTITDGVMVGRENTWAAGYTGEGMKIAVIDTGLDIDHQNFAALGEEIQVTATPDTVAAVLSELNATARYGTLAVEDVYYNTKVAYGFNYVDNNLNITHDYDSAGDHGSHVAGIAAANKVEESAVVGVAPNAQLYIMKVFGANGGAYTEDILAALEDALKLGADVINMSLGSPAGFTTAADEIMNIYNRVADTNTVLSVSAGNNYTAGYDNAWGTDKNLTSNPDNAVVGQPAVYNNVMSVASVENLAVQREYIQVSDGYRMVYNDTGVNYGIDSITTLTGEYNVVFVPNYGEPADFEGLDLEGKIAVVARGSINFYEKIANAEAAGAIACIVYNNTSGEFGMDLSTSPATIPGVSITLADASYLYEALAADENLTVSFPTDVSAFPSATAYEMSEFSSWGVAPDLSLEPDITAPGGNIYSTINGGQYGLMSGTSMAAPNMAGLTALVMEYIREEMPEEQNIRVLAQNLMTSTAAPLPYGEEGSGLFYSPRQQGTGLANAFNAVTTKTYLTVDGVDVPKVELGDDDARTGAYSYQFNVHNFGDTKAYYDVSTVIQTEGVDAYEGGYYFMGGVPMALPGMKVADSANLVLTHDVDDSAATNSHDAYIIYQAANGNKAENFASEEFRYDTDGNGLVDTNDVQAYLDALVGNASAADLADESLCVDAGETAQVSVSVALADVSKEFLDVYFPNGAYVEGFTFLDALNEGTTDLSLPYLGFYGDWDAAPILDSGDYWDILNGVGEYSQYPNILFTEFGTDTYYPGVNVYVDEVVDPAHISLSPNGDGYFDSVNDIYTSLLRNASELVYSFTDVTDPENPEELYKLTVSNVRKTVYMSAYGQIVPEIYSWYEGQVPLYDWKAADGSDLENNDVILLEISATGAYEGAHTETWAVPVTIDMEAPQLLAAERFTSGGMEILGLSFRDNLACSVLALMNSNGEELYAMMGVEDTEEDENGYQNYTLYFNVTGLTGKLMIVLGDYALNEAYYGVNMGGEGASYGQLVGYSNYIGNTESGWVSFGEGVNMDEVMIFLDGSNVVCAEYVGGYVFAQTETGALYGFKYEDMLKDTFVLESTFVAQLDNVYQDMAYSYKEGKLYGLLTYTDGDGYPTTEINSINLRGQYYDENMWMDVMPYQEDYMLGRGGLYGLTLAIDDEGTAYVLGNESSVDWDENGDPVYTEDETASLWMVPCEYDEWSGSYMLGWSLTKLGNIEQTMDYLQSMTWDHNTETLYWARMDVDGYTPVSELYVIEAEWTVNEFGELEESEVSTEKVGTLSGEISGLFAPLSDEAAAKDEHLNLPEMDPEVAGTPILRDEVVTMNVTGSKKLTYDMDPWYTNHKSVVWSSSDEAVVTVGENGVIHCLAAGSAVITVANAADESKFDTVEVQVTALDLVIEGIISAQNAGVGNVTGASTYQFEMVEGVSSFGTVNAITAPQDLNFGLSLATSAMGRGSIWACEYGNTGMIYEIDAETGVVKDVIEPIDGDMMLGLSYSESQDTFTGIMNMFIYADLELTHEETEKVVGTYDEEQNMFMYHRINMLPYLLESGDGFVTGETGQGASSEIVFSGITTIEGGDVTYLYMDYLGNWSAELAYIPTQTLVLLDNVGRLWFIDEIKNMTVDSVTEWGTSYVDENGSFVSTEFHGVEAIETGDGVYSVFVIRELAETSLTDMFRDGTLPRITYHFSDIELAGFTADGAPMIAMSLYDYWNNGTTNELYLYIPGVGTGEFTYDENWNYVELKTPDRLYSLGNTGEYNIIASIHFAEVTGGVDEVIDNVQTEEEYLEDLGVNALIRGVYQSVN